MKNNFTSHNLTLAFRTTLRDERKRRKLTQFELAIKCGLTRQTISFFENGKRTPTLFSLILLAKGLNMPAAKFLSLLMRKIEYYEHRKHIVSRETEK